MNLEIQKIICFMIVVISIILSIKNVIKNEMLDDIVESIIAGTSTIITFFIMVANYEVINDFASSIVNGVFSKYNGFNGIANILLIVIIFCAIKYVIQIVLNLLHSIMPNSNRKRRGKVVAISLSVVLGFIRGIVVIVLITIPIVLYNNIVDSDATIDIFKGFSTYDKVEELVHYEKLEIVSDGLKENMASNTITYYNGVTIDEAVLSNDEIDNKAKALTEDSENDRDAALTIYIWVGTNIDYDNGKAEKILLDKEVESSGAIPTYKDKSGICFDYSCLYTAMCRAIGLKSRIVVGEAFNGKEYISHAWNEVYIEDEDKWINVDTTFYDAGNYFDNTDFEKNHIKKNIAGEF